MKNLLSHKSMLAGLLALGLLATACSQPASPVPSTDQSVAPSAAASTAASTAPSIVVDPSIDPSTAPSIEASPDAVEGIALVDVDIELLKGAYEGYGFIFGDAPVVEGDVTYWSGDHNVEDVRVVMSFEDDLLLGVNLYDYTAGDEGIDDMGFTIGIFAPEAEAWLVENLEAALAAPGEAYTITSTFEYVTLTINAYTDDAQSIDLIVD